MLFRLPHPSTSPCTLPDVPTQPDEGGGCAGGCAIGCGIADGGELCHIWWDCKEIHCLCGDDGTYAFQDEYNGIATGNQVGVELIWDLSLVWGVGCAVMMVPVGMACQYTPGTSIYRGCIAVSVCQSTYQGV